MPRLDDKSPEAEYENISSVLFPGGVDQPGRLDNERLMKSRFGAVVAWFTISETPEGDHPSSIKEAWIGVPLPVRELMDDDAENVSIPVFAIDAFNALADARAPETVLEYWFDAFRGQNPTLWFNASDGSVELNSLLER